MSSVLQIPTAEVFLPLLAPARYKGAHGGRGSGKSHFFADSLLDHCIVNPGTRAVCVREIQKSLDQSVKQLLEDKIDVFDLGKLFEVKTAEVVTPGNGLILFQGMQNHTAESIKSLEGYDIAWVEEAQSLSQRSLDLLRPTIRKENSELWFSWNPRMATDPIDAFLRAGDVPPQAIVVQANYRDNPWLPDVLRAEMEWDRSHDPEKYAHVWLGEYERHSESRVFKNWTVAAEPIQAPPGAVFYFGADWGFSVDPTVLIRCWLDAKERTLYVDREVYKVGCEIENTPKLFDTLENGQARNWPIIADSARPETISYVQRHGYPRIQPARKGPGSIEEGVTFLQNYRIIVDPSCYHTIDELTMYSYKTDKLTGQVLPILEDKKNHVIDALRYAVETLRAVKPTLAAIGSKSYRERAWQRDTWR